MRLNRLVTGTAEITLAQIECQKSNQCNDQSENGMQKSKERGEGEKFFWNFPGPRRVQLLLSRENREFRIKNGRKTVKKMCYLKRLATLSCFQGIVHIGKGIFLK